MESFDDLPTFDLDSIRLGKLLGQGGFASVFSFHLRKQQKKESISFDLSGTSSKQLRSSFVSTTATDISGSIDCSSIFSDSSDEASLEDEEALEDQVKEEHSELQELALKTLHDGSLSDRKKRDRAAKDLRNEVCLLTDVGPHPHIIELHGISDDFWRDSDSAFIVMEKLQEPLDRAIRRWKGEVTGRSLSLRPRKNMNRSAQALRIQKAAVGIASALQHLHNEDTVFRDLKPANCGFDQAGNIKLFDFACARYLTPGTRMQQRTGTLRYMSGECARKEFYDLSTDIHSFAMFLFELLTLEKPYGKITDRRQLNRLICSEEKRPSLNRICASGMRDLISKCWSTEPQKRPDFDYILECLNTEIEKNLSQR